MNTDSLIYVAGHTGLLGSAICHNLRHKGFHNLLLATKDELDLTQEKATAKFFLDNSPEYVFLAAAKVGGIEANGSKPADFITQNLRIQTNVIQWAHRSSVKKLMFLGSSCIYPRNCPQPINESYLLTGSLEPTNQAYAVAKIAGIEMCRAFNQQYGTNYLCAMPTNLYGPGDNFDLTTSHVMPALIRKMHEAKMSGKPPTLWGTGSPRREFLYVDDAADAIVFLMENYHPADQGFIINVGSGYDITVSNLARLVGSVIGYVGDGFNWNTTRPDGTPRKLLDSTLLFNLGWRTKTNLRAGIAKTYDWYTEYDNQ